MSIAYPEITTVAEDPTSEFQPVFWATKRALAQASARAFSRHGVHNGQQYVLQCLWEEDGLTPGELARRLDLATPTVTRAAHRMEASGLLSRRRHERDGRLVRLFLTERGRALERVIDQERAALNERALASLDQSQRAALVQALATVHRNLS
jgi:DNA-binding MarR family transcriptional regulator